MLALVAAPTGFVGASALMAAQRAPVVRMQQQTLESPIPGVARPGYLDGTLAGDVGLDPLEFVTRFKEGVKVTVPAMQPPVAREPMDSSFTALKKVTEYNLCGQDIILGPNTKDTARSLMWMRESEVKHARLAMLAAAGWPLAELWHGPICKITGADYALDVTQGRSLSVLNGGLWEVRARTRLTPAPWPSTTTLSPLRIASRTPRSRHSCSSSRSPSPLWRSRPSIRCTASRRQVRR